MSKFQIKLGSRVRDVVTGFEGIVLSRSQWLHNCNTYGVKPLDLKDGKPQGQEGFDEPQLEVLEGPEGVLGRISKALALRGKVAKKKKTGGPVEAVVHPQDSA